MALIALGVTGGVGAYKAVEVCRGLQTRGHDVVAVMTRAATRFVGPLTFEAITRRPVITSQWRPGMNADIEHIAIADGIALLLVAPCTANVIGKFANGIADDFLSSLYLATNAPVLIAPAMNVNMLAHDAVKRNLDMLAASSSPVKAIWRAAGSGKGGSRNRPRSSTPRSACSRLPSQCFAGAGSWSPQARPTKTSMPSATSAIDRAVAWGMRSQPKRGGAARS
jgi:phosphopantothenoylcysteine synthetase/decarboxylase